MTDKIETIYDFYDSLLTVAGYETDADGTIWLAGGKDRTQVSLSGKKVVLPLKSRLKEPRDDEMFFHPLCEQMQRYESEIFKFIKRSLTVKLISATANIGSGLLKLQENPQLQRNMSIEQIEVIKGISEFDKNSTDAWVKMLMRPLGVDKFRMDLWPIHIYLKRNGTFGGKNYRRVASTSFPFAVNIINGEVLYSENGKNSFRGKDYTMFSEVFQAIWPNAKDPGEEYNAGWNDAVAPYLSSFLIAFKKLATRLNYLSDLFKAEFDEVTATDSHIDLSWYDLLIQDDLKDYTTFSGAIPQLKGNTGDLTEEGDPEEKPVEVKDTRPARQQEKPPVKEAAVEEKPKPAASSPSVPTLSPGEQKLLDDARAKKAAWKAEQDREAEADKRRDERRQERDREDEEYNRQRREREERRRGDDSDPPWNEESKTTAASGKVSASDIFSRRDDRGRDDRDRGRDDRDRGRDRDRDYDRGRDRDRDYDRGRDREYDRGRDYRDDRDRDYDRGRDRDRDFFDRGRDDRGRDDRGYDRGRDDRERSLRGSPWGRSGRDDRDRGYRR